MQKNPTQNRILQNVLVYIYLLNFIKCWFQNSSIPKVMSDVLTLRCFLIHIYIYFVSTGRVWTFTDVSKKVLVPVNRYRIQNSYKPINEK